jgi:hypothetical protein
MSYLAAALLTIVGAGCVLLVVVQLPGGWVLLALALLLEYLDRLYLPAGNRQTFSWWLLGTGAALLAAGEIVEFVAGVEGARRGGSSRRGMVGALLGGILGAFVLTPVLFFVPVVGALVGAVVGTFIGAVVGEMTAPQASLGATMKPALGAAVGRAVGTVSKVGVTIALWLMLAIGAFWP